MTRPKEAIERLWKAGFFKTYRTTKSLENKAFREYGCTCSNWSTLLKDSNKFLRKTKKGWIQKVDSHKDEEIKILLIEKGRPREATKNFEEIVKSFTDPISILDPYLTRAAMDLLEKIPSKSIKFLFHKKETKLSQREIEDFKKENPKIALKQYPDDHLHDRYILSNDKMLIIGHGLSLRNKETFIIELTDDIAKDLRVELVATFNRRWNRSKEV